MDCIDTFYSLAKNTMIDDAEQQIEYGQREPADCEKSLKTQAIGDRPEQAFVSEELKLIPEDTELPPDYVLEW